MVKDDLVMDRGYAWVVMAASFGIEVVTGVLYGCVGFITNAIVEVIDSNLTRASLVSSTLLGTYAIFGPVAGLIQDKIGHRSTGITSGVLMLIGLTSASFCKTILGLVLTFGIITGVGLGLAANVSGVALGNYFDKKLPVVYGICMSGGGLGIFFIGRLTVFLLELYSMSGTFLIIGSIVFHVSLAGVLIRPRTKVDTAEDISLNSEVGSAKDDSCMSYAGTEILAITECDTSGNDRNVQIEEENCIPKKKPVELSSTSDPLLVETDLQQRPGSIQPKYQDNPISSSLMKWFYVLRSNGFFLYAVSILFCCAGESACMVHLPNYLEFKGSTAEQSANVLSGIGIISIVSGILAGFAASDQSIPKLVLHAGFLGLSGMINIILPLFSHTYPLQMAFGILYGLYSQALYSLLGPICIELSGLSNLAAAYGLTSFFLGVGYLIGPPIAALLYETSGVYDYTYVFAGCSMVVGALSVAFIPMFKKKKKADVHVRCAL